MRCLAITLFAGFSVLLGGCLPENTLPEPRPVVEEELEENVKSPSGAAPGPTTPVLADKSPSPDATATPADAEIAPKSEAHNSAGPVGAKAPAKSKAEELAAKLLRKRPATPLTMEERRARSSQNLYQISRALTIALFKNKEFPGDIVDRSGKPLLSWRVRLLPLLGLEELTDEFHMNEPWDSPHNLQLLASIPSFYQSPDRFDARTNYLAPIGPNTVIDASRGSKLNYPADGFAQTILVVEADEELATPWTKPADLPFDPTQPRRGLGHLREDGFFAVLGSAKAHVITNDLDDATVASLFSVLKEGETAKKAQPTRTLLENGVTAPTDVAPLEPLALDGRHTPPTTSASSEGVFSDAAPREDSPDEGEPTVAKSSVKRHSLPADAALEVARAEVRQLYQSKYKEAKTSRERAKIATEVLERASEMGDDHAGRYVMLKAAIDIASANGDITVSRDACDELGDYFDVDLVRVQLDAVKALGGSVGAKDQNGRRKLAEWADEICDEAYERDNFNLVRESYQVALGMAKSADDRELLRTVMSRYSELEEARREYAQIGNVIKTWEENPDDPNASRVLGQYLCFVKGEWSQGLPLLVKGSDPRLAEVAELDLQRPEDAGAQAELADAWWRLAEGESDHRKKHLQERAVYWYQLAAAGLPPGLAKVKAEIRMKQIEEERKEKEKPLLQ